MVARHRILGALVAALALVAGVLAVGASPAGAEPGGVVISELNYHAGSDLDTDDFLGLANTSAAPMDMSGWTFTAGITGTLPAGSVIPAGGSFVVSPDAARFQVLHGFAPDAIYTGKLSNGGETVTLTNGATVIDTVTYADADPWPPAPDGTGPTLELRGLNYDNTLPESWGASTTAGGTPKTVNSINGTPPQPKATNVVATPLQPDPNQVVVVSAHLPVGSTATLAYKVMFAANVNIPFLDDAASPGGASDGNYAAIIPGQGAGKLVRYRITATTTGGVAFSHPVAGDTINYEGVVVKDPSVITNLPVFTWFMEDSVYNDLLANHRYDDITGPAVVAWNGQVVDNTAMRVRGNSSRDAAKVSWKVELPSGHVLDMRPRMPYPLDEFALGRDTDPLADLGWNVVNGSGARGLTMFPVRTQRNAAFHSVGHIMETEDGTWRDAKGVDKWSIYKGDGGSLTRTSSAQVLATTTAVNCPLCLPGVWLDKKTRTDEDYTDAWQLSQVIDASASATQREWMYQNLNIPELINYMAINSVIRDADSGWYNWWLTRDTEGTGRYELWHWDLNWIFTTNADDGKGTFLTPDTSNRMTQALLRYPEFTAMFYRRLRTLADQWLLPQGKFEAMWDGLANQYINDWNMDRAKWGGYTPTGARNVLLQGLADRYAVIANNTGSGKPVPASQSAAPNVVINEIQYQPVGGTNAEFIELTNPSSSESVDISGWTVDSIGLTVPAGTVLLPGANVVFVKNDVTFRATYPAANRFVGGQYTGTLADTGMTLTLRQGTRVVDEVTYAPTAPWPTAAAGTGPSLELRTPGADNADPANWTATSAAGGTPAAANNVVLSPDTTPPSAPGTLSASGTTSTQTTLTWGAASDNRGVAGYQVVRNGTALPGTVTGLSFTDTGLSPSSTYTYTVRAIDTSNVVGPASNPATVNTPATGSTLFSDPFTASNGAAWGSGWTTGATNGSATIQSNTGQLAFNNTSGAWARSQLTGTAATTNSDLLLSYQWNSANPKAYFSVFTRGSGGWLNAYRPNNGYGLELTPDSTTVTLKKVVNGATTNLASTAGAQATGTAKQWLRLRANGTTIQYRIWTDGTTEPTTWRATVTDTSVTAPGQTFLSLVRSSSATEAKNVRIDNVQIADPNGSQSPDTTPPSAPGTLSASGTTSTQTTLTWGAASDNRGVAGYQVVRNGTALPGTVTGLSFTDTGLSPSSTYTYTVRAIDTSNVVGPASNPATVNTPATGSTLFSDPFTASNGAAWGSGWTTGATNGSATIQSNTGQLAFNNTSGAWARSQLTGTAATTNSDLLLSYQWNSANPKAYFSVFTRGSGGWLNAYRPNNGYGLELTPDSTTVTLKKVVNGATTNLASTAGAQATGTAKQWLRLRANGTTIQYRIWTDGTTEPTTWRATVTDTSVTAPGQTFLSLVRSSSATEAKNVRIDNLTLSTP